MKFAVERKDYSRLAAWFQFFDQEIAVDLDFTLAEKFNRAQYDPEWETPEHTIELSEREAEHVRIWFDYVPCIVFDDSDDRYSIELDAYLANCAKDREKG